MTAGETLGQRLRIARDAAHMTHGDIAEHLCITRSAISQWETDVTTPRGPKVRRLAAILGVRAGWLLVGEEPMLEHGGPAPQSGSLEYVIRKLGEASELLADLQRQLRFLTNGSAS